MESTIQFEEKNHEYLTLQVLPQLGFGGVLNEALRNAMNTANNLRQNEITLSVGSKASQMRYDLTLNRSEKGTYFFLNKVKASSIANTEQGELTMAAHTFTLFNQAGFNARQMKNLVRGGAVREIVQFKGKKEKFARWRRLDLTKTNEQGNFVEKKPYYESDLNVDYPKLLSNLPIYGSQEDKENLLKDIYDGELVKAYATVGKERQQIYLEATPHLGDKLTVYNQQMKKIYLTTKGIENSMEVISEPLAPPLEQNPNQTISNGEVQQPGETTPPIEQTISGAADTPPIEQHPTIPQTSDATPPDEKPSVEQTGHEHQNPTQQSTTADNPMTTDPAQLKPDGTSAPAGAQDNPASGENPPLTPQRMPQNDNDTGKKAQEMSSTTASLLEGPKKNEKEQKPSKKNRL